MTSGLSICSVNCRSGDILNANWKLTAGLNGDVPERWIVVETTRTGDPGAVGAAERQFQVLRGLADDEEVPADGDYQHGIKIFSYEHGIGLNQAVKHVTTRWVLFLDPDFCILTREWCRRIPEYMERQELAFFGAPHHAHMWRKYRYFPAAFCMFVDLAKVPKESLDFRPILRHRTWLSRLIEKRFPRLLIGRVPDTGWRVYTKYGGGKAHRIGLVQPGQVAAPPDGLLRGLARALIPDSLLTAPKRKGYVTPYTFPAFGYPDAKALGQLSDEYFWQDRPFGVHIRPRLQQSDPQRLPAFILSLAADAGGCHAERSLRKITVNSSSGRPPLAGAVHDVPDL